MRHGCDGRQARGVVVSAQSKWVAMRRTTGGRSWTRSKRLAVGCFACLAVIGCAPSDPAAANRGQSPATAVDRALKTVTVVQLNGIKSFSSDDFSNTSGGGASLAEIHMNGLVTNDRVGGVEPRLAAKLPSIDDGSIVIPPDGRMQTTWRLRPDVTWHDGTPFTAQDVAFSWQVGADPGFPMSGSAKVVMNSIEQVQTPDALTAVITWKAPYYRAVELGHRDFWLMPKHVLGQLADPDKEEFLNAPHWSTEYIHLGPFRLVDFGLGERLVFERYDAYFLGRPRLDRIIIRVVPDPNVVLADLKADATDIATEKTLPLDVFVLLRDDWRQSGAGTLVERQENWRYLWFQFDPQWARPIEISQDVRIRRGLLYGLDRDAVRDFLLPGFTDSSGDTFMPKNDPRTPIVGLPFASFRYDPSRAAQELASAGWRRASDGRLLNAAGEQVQFEVRGDPVDAKETALIADAWRQLGIDITEQISPLSLSRNAEYKSKFPGAEPRARATGDQIFSSFDSREHSVPQNRWIGTNAGHYANPTLDGLIDRLYRTVGQRQQGLILKDMGELLAEELPAIPLYYRTTFAAVSRGVHALLDDYAGTQGPGAGPGVLSRNAHLWDRE
ncbi:MAG: hypothetical protein HW416_3052 [Chloroflexi bacterium]|nr:hypothetical protein [Chloroflexota bacterium]